MTRPKKEGKSKDNATITIPLESYMSTRDHVVTSLTTIQGAIGDLLRAYVHHTTQVLGGHAASSELAGATSALLSGIEEAAAAALPAGVAATVAPGVIKKQKQRRKKDPNAPKAPPTAYFLYAKNARPLIKQDLGPDAKGDAVTFEASRRWNELPDNEKEGWRNMYKANFTKYKEELLKYNAEKAALGEDVLEPEAVADEVIADEMDVDPLQASAAAAAAADDDSDSGDDTDSTDSTDSDESDAAPPPPPPKPADTPKKKGRPAKGAAGAAANGASKPREAAAVPADAGAAKAKGGAEKKRKAADAVAAPPAPAVVAAAPANDDDDGEPKKKKKKSSSSKKAGADNIDPTLESAVPAVADAAKKKKSRKA